MNARVVFLPALLLSILLAGGCADDNEQAPAIDEAHPPQWIFVHDEEARQDLARCQSCHAPDLRGNGEAVSCFECHFQGPPEFADFGIHPFHWDNVIVDHQTFPAEFSWTTCGNFACHGETLKGGVTGGPSCFLAGCHAEGPPAPHPAAFSSPQLHGPVAKNAQFFCRNCHGRPPYFFDGGYIADPQISNVPAGNCSLPACHPVAMAHPRNWIVGHQSIDLTRVPSVIAESCALCHAIATTDASPLAGAPECRRCHPGGFAPLAP